MSRVYVGWEELEGVKEDVGATEGRESGDEGCWQRAQQGRDVSER